LAVTELMSAFGLMTRSGRLAVGQFELFTRRLRKQVGARILHVVAISDEDFSGAEVLLEKYARTRALKASDAVQAAVAARLRRVVDHFVCADRDLSEVARLEGFSVIDPEQS